MPRWLSLAISLVVVFQTCKNPDRLIQSNSPPKILFVMTDDQAWNLLHNEERYPFLKTPNLDKLTAEGMVFNNCFVTTSLCSPSRASFLTGCYAHLHGVAINEANDPSPQTPIIPRILQEAGYNTAFIGKWHMAPDASPRPGFDYWLSFRGQGQYMDPELNENGKEIKEDGYITDILTDYAIRWIELEREKPFCLFLWHKAMHAPFTPAREDSVAFDGAQIPEYDNWYDTMEGKPKWLRRGWTYGVHNEVWKASEGKPVPDKIIPNPWDPQNQMWLNYLRTLMAIDRGYGRIHAKLEEMGMLDQTMIIFSSDNGYFLGSHQRGDKRLMYEESIRIPLIIHYPPLIAPGTVSQDFILNIDLAPTLVDLAGLPLLPTMQGTSLLPLLKEKTNTNWRNSFLYEYFQESYAPGLVTMLGVRNERYKYIHFPELSDDIDELYDLLQDPGEMHNLILNPDYRDVLQAMKTELEKLLDQTNYQKPEIRE